VSIVGMNASHDDLYCKRDEKRAFLAKVDSRTPVLDRSNAWNYLSFVCLKLQLYAEAEEAARNALTIYGAEPKQNEEIIACYEFMLGRILAAQCRFQEATESASAGVRHYAVLHAPFDAFLLARISEANRMRDETWRWEDWLS
jgi:hypothetical protein